MSNLLFLLTLLICIIFEMGHISHKQHAFTRTLGVEIEFCVYDMTQQQAR